MPIAPVDDEDTVLYYEDSGVPDGSVDYATVVLIHGMLFHGAVFRRLIPYAALHNVRLVFVNMRDYPGSSRFSPEELKAIASSDRETQAKAIKALGLQISAFLVHIIKKCDIPKFTEENGKKKGGLALLGWSLGNLVSMSMLGNAGTLPDDTKDFLERYLRTVVMYDPSNTSLGESPPERVYNPLRDPALTLEQRGKLFLTTISRYMTAIPDPSSVTEEALNARTSLHEAPAGTAMDASKSPTVLRMTPSEFDSVTDYDALERSNELLRHVAREVYNDNFRRALLDTGGVWKDVRVLYVWCDMSVSDCIWATKQVAQRLEEVGKQDSRMVQFERLTGANHFVSFPVLEGSFLADLIVYPKQAHWDDPESVVQLLAANV
ncbi:hypothetical protein EW026_g5466 [Hermanssonia centrifuga]|uniref:AB hydrolase-1 domain-containing protein n=1 Tax=Hermanssonia centrifuga TaxID=98765 RepID=A0A4S4KE25_9APHY|nr:hypothetical protein EW026_g5466 [Hermanssonia centrifuga]